MGDTNITSNNQQGGITAQNVNTGSGKLSVHNKESKPKNNLWKIVAGVIAFIAAIVAILTYLEINPFK